MRHRVFLLVLVVGVIVSFFVLNRSFPWVQERIKITLTAFYLPLLKGVRFPIEMVSHTSDTVHRFLEVWSDNKLLHEKNRTLQKWHLEARRLEAQNRALRTLTHYIGKDREVMSLSARIIGDTGGPFVQSVLVGAGRKEGMEKDFIAVTHRGVVGRVISVGTHIARILPLTDVNSRIPVTNKEGTLRAILGGRNWDTPVLLYTRRYEPIRVGDTIITSGYGGVFPFGLPVGVVVSLHPALVKPYAQIDSTFFIRLVKFSVVKK